MRAPLLEWMVAALCALFVLWSGVMKPDHDWDIIGYVAAALHAEGEQGESLHAHTYDLVRQEVGEKQFAKLVDVSDPYRRTVHASADALVQHVPFYGIRVLHVGAIRVLHQLTGLPIPRALAWLNALVGAGSVLVCFGLMRSMGLPAILLPLLIWWAGVRDVAKLSTPDGLAALLALGTVAALLSQRWRTAMVLAVVLPAARTDYVLWSFLAMLVVMHLTPMRTLPALTALMAGAVHGGINHWFHNPGHWVIFNFTLIHKHPWPAQQTVAHDWHDYLNAYVQHGLVESLGQRGIWLWPLILTVLVLGWVKPKSHRALAWLSLSFVLLHMLLFPLYLQRFFVAPVAIATVVLCHTIWLQCSQARPREGTNTMAVR